MAYVNCLEVTLSMTNYILHQTMDVIDYPYPNRRETMLVKGPQVAEAM